MFNMQTTIKDDIKFEGIGVHTNTKSCMILKPSDPGSGISFRRTDVKDPSKNTIKANYKNVKSTYYCTEISNEFDVSVLTIEHLLAAIFGANIDNVEILIDGPEVPILDGSSKIFMDGIQDNQIINQGQAKKFIKILEPIEVNHNNAFASFTPNDKLIVDAQIDFIESVICKVLCLRKTALKTAAFDVISNCMRYSTVIHIFLNENYQVRISVYYYRFQHQPNNQK